MAAPNCDLPVRKAPSKRKTASAFELSWQRRLGYPLTWCVARPPLLPPLFLPEIKNDYNATMERLLDTFDVRAEARPTLREMMVGPRALRLLLAGFVFLICFLPRERVALTHVGRPQKKHDLGAKTVHERKNDKHVSTSQFTKEFVQEVTQKLATAP